jgi:hypothetical protein
VGGGDDRGALEPEPAHEDRGGGRGQHAGQQRLAPGGGHAGGQRALEHRAGLTGVADDEQAGPLGLRGGPGALDHGAAEAQGQLGGQQLAGHPADAVGPEQSSLRHLRADANAY